VCSFGALRVVDDSIQLDAAVCRGCGLCTAVCPTSTLRVAAVSMPDHRDADAPIVIACQRRTGSIPGANVIRLRCVGSIDAGQLLNLLPGSNIRIAGCAEDRCRFTTGAHHAMEQIERARTIAEMLGLPAENIVSDWSPDRLHDPLIGDIPRRPAGLPVSRTGGAA
jgi:ferredoxin